MPRSNAVLFAAQTTPAAPAAGTLVYAKAGGLYYREAGGAEVGPLGSGGGAPAANVVTSANPTANKLTVTTSAAMPSSPTDGDLVLVTDAASGVISASVRRLTTTDVSRTSMTVTDDATLTIPVVSGRVYRAFALLNFGHTVNVIINTPAVVASDRFQFVASGTPVGTMQYNGGAYPTQAGITMMNGVLRPTASGNLRVAWASGNGASMTMIAGSLLIVEDIT